MNNVFKNFVLFLSHPLLSHPLASLLFHKSHVQINNNVTITFVIAEMWLLFSSLPGADHVNVRYWISKSLSAEIVTITLLLLNLQLQKDRYNIILVITKVLTDRELRLQFKFTCDCDSLGNYEAFSGRKKKNIWCMGPFWTSRLGQRRK